MATSYGQIGSQLYLIDDASKQYNAVSSLPTGGSISALPTDFNTYKGTDTNLLATPTPSTTPATQTPTLDQATINSLTAANTSGFNYLLPDGTVIKNSGPNAQTSATVNTADILQGRTSSPIPDSILSLAKQQYAAQGTPTTAYNANTSVQDSTNHGTPDTLAPNANPNVALQTPGTMGNASAPQQPAQQPAPLTNNGVPIQQTPEQRAATIAATGQQPVPQAPLTTGTQTGAAGNLDSNYKLQPGESIDAYNARIAAYNASKPVTQPSGPVGQSGSLGSTVGQTVANDPYAGLDPVAKQVKMYTDAYNALGLSTIKQQFDDYTKQLGDIQNELNDKKQANQNNPWLSQGLVDRENAKLDTKYAVKIDTFTKLLTLTDSMYKQGQAQVDHLVSDANADIKATNDLAQKMTDATASLAKDTEVVSLGGDQWLVNKSTGAKIANLGPVTVSSTAMTLADKEALAAFQAGLKSPSDAVKTQVVSIDGHQWLVNTQTGAKIQDLGKVTTSNPLDSLFPDTPSTPTTPQYAASLYDQVGGGIDWPSLGL